MPRKSSASNNLKRSPFNVREAVGSNIKRHRLVLGWSQQELADRFGVSRAAVSQYEIGTGEVNAGDLPRLADLLGISLLEFYEGKPLDLRPIDRQPTQHAEGRWAVEAAASLLKTSGDEPAAAEQAGATGQGSMNESEPGSGDPAGRLFLLDHQHQVACPIIPALKQDCSHEAIAHLAELAGDFLSLSRRDQETLSRVAEALKVQTQHAQTQREHTKEL